MYENIVRVLSNSITKIRLSFSHAKQKTPAIIDSVQSARNPMNRWLWYSVAGFLVFDNLAIFYHLLFSRDKIDALTIIGDINNTSGWLLAVFFCITRLPQSWWSKETRATLTSPLQIAQQKVPLWLACTFSVNAIERGAYMYYDLIHTTPPLDWPSIILLLRYPFLLLAVVSLYKRPLSLLARLRLALDGLLILTALLTFSWYFLIGPIILKFHQDILVVIDPIAYPLADLILCFYLFQLSFRNGEPILRFVRRLFSLGLLGIVVADIFDISQLLQTSPILPIMQSLTLCLGYILIALSVQFLHKINAQQPIHGNRQDDDDAHDYTLSPFLWQNILSSASVPVILLFIAIIRLTKDTSYLAIGVLLAGPILIIMLVIRQILVMYETFVSNRKLQTVQKELYKKNLALTQANHLLEEQAQQLALAYEQQNQASKLKDQFLLNVNHELRTPLTELHGYLELLQLSQETMDTQTHKRFLSHALNGSRELQRLVNTILDALRSEHARETLHSEDVCVASTMQEVIELFDPRKRAAYQLDLLVPEGLSVYADRQYLRQILTNLLSNAFKYSPPQTAIVVTAQTIPAAITAKDAPSSVLLWVQDYGPGIPHEDVASLFDKFFRLAHHQNGSIRGSGLGLYICKQLVEAMDGQIWVESSGIPGEGSRFCFTLPSKHA